MLSLNNNAALRNLSALVDFSNLINSNLELEFTLNNLLLTCFGKFHTSKGLIALANVNDELIVKAYKGITPQVLKNFPQPKLNAIENNNELKNFLVQNNLLLSHPIEASGKKIGFLFLGRRLIGKDYDYEDVEFIKTLVNIAASAIENSIGVERLKNVNRDLDQKVNQLSSLFDLSKEFSGILEIERVGKLLMYSIIGQLLVTKFAVVTCEDGVFKFIENRFPSDKLTLALSDCRKDNFTKPVYGDELLKIFPSFNSLGIEMIVPMQIKSETKGLIILGKKTTMNNYSKSDIEYISSVGSLAIISIENGRLFKETIEKQRLEKDLEIAQNIQKNLLPNKFPQLKNFEISAANYSARQVGGDYYDIVPLDKSRTLVAIADVSGKGVQAALLMANLQAFLQSICKQNIELSQASNLINDLVSENTTDGSFITFFWGILNDENKSFKYVNMGHNPPLLISEGKISKLKLGGMILGVMPTVIPYKSESVQLKKGDRIIFYTDGITEAMNKDGLEYSEERLEKLCLMHELSGSKDTLDLILKDVKEHADGAAQSDDITAMVIKVN